MPILILCLLGFKGPIPDVIVDDALITPNGFALESPSIALYWNGDLFIGDKNIKRIFVRRKDGSLVTFGQPGNGPGEFVNHAEHLFVRDGSLVIEEWNRWREYLFSDTGSFISSKRLERFVYDFHGSRYRKLEAKNAMKVGFLYEKLGTDQFVCRLESRDFEGIHLTRGYLRAGPNGTVVAFKRGGMIEVYDAEAKRIYKMILPLEVFKKKMTEDKLSTGVTIAASGYGKAFQGGTPLIDGVVESLSRVWILAKDEHTEDRHFLMEVDVEKSKVLSRTDLDQPCTRISLNQGVLALVSPETSVVMTYKTQ